MQEFKINDIINVSKTDSKWSDELHVVRTTENGDITASDMFNKTYEIKALDGHHYHNGEHVIVSLQNRTATKEELKKHYSKFPEDQRKAIGLM